MQSDGRMGRGTERRGKSAGMKEGEQRGMKNTMKLIAKMSENGDTEYIARLLEPEVYQRMMDKYGME